MNSFFLGLDIGGTNVRIVSYNDSDYCISHIKKVPFKRSGNSKCEVDENLCELITAIVNEKSHDHEKLRGIGISLAALFDRASGDITIWPNNKVWNGFPLRSYLMERFKVPVLIEDDANSAALGEHILGAGKGHSNFAYITISTGVGCGLMLNNSLYTGANGWAGEIGHIKVVEDGPECNCGMKGCLQSLVSGPALLKKFAETKMLKNFQDTEKYDLKDIVNLAYQGDSAAREVFLQAGVHIGKMIASIVMLLDISLVVIGGGVAGAGDILLAPVSNTVDACLKQFKRNVKIERSQLGDNNGAIGALSLIYRHINNGKFIQI